jgi:hypothetical protein
MSGASGGGGGKAGKPPAMPGMGGGTPSQQLPGMNRLPQSPGMQQLQNMPMSPGMNALQKLPGAPPMPGQGLGGIARSIQSLPGFGGGTGVSSGQQGDAPWQSTGKPMDQELEAQRLLGYNKGPNAADPNALQAQQMPAGGGMFGAGGAGDAGLAALRNQAMQGAEGQGGAPASLDWMNKAAAQKQDAMNGQALAPGQAPQSLDWMNRASQQVMQKPGAMNRMAQMLGSAPPTPLGPMQAQLGAGGGAAAMGEPASFGKSGGAGKAKAAKRGR